MTTSRTRTRKRKQRVHRGDRIRGVVTSVAGAGRDFDRLLVLFLRPWLDADGVVQPEELRVQMPIKSAAKAHGRAAHEAIARAQRRLQGEAVALTITTAYPAGANSLETAETRAVRRVKVSNELVGAGAMVPPAHLEAVRAAFDSALARARADAPGEGEVRHASQAMAAAHRALHDAVRDWTPRGRDASGDELTPCDATYEVHDLAEVEALLAGHADLVATGPGRFAWLGEALPGTEGALERTGRDHAMLGGAADDGGPSVFVMVRADPRGGPPRRVLGDVELRTVRLTLACMTRPQLAAGRALLEGLLGGRLRFRHQRFEAVGDLLARGERERARAAEVEAKALRAVDPRDATPLDVQVQRWLDAHPEALAALEEGAARRAAALTHGDEDAVPAPRSSASPGEHHLRPLPHERMRLAQPAAIELAERLARAERQRPGWEGRSITARSLAGREEFDELLLARGRGLVAQGWTPEDAAQDAHTLASHVHYAANYFLHHRKTFWVDDALAWALHRTTLDVPGACLRLPFPAAAFVFADRTTLDLAESLLAGDAPGGARTSPVEMLTVYVLRDEETPAGVAVRLALLFDRRDEELRPDPAERWPYLLGRDLLVRPDDRLDAILDSRHDDLPAGGPDPVFLAPEMTRLVHLVLNAVLYSTSRLLTPPAVVGPPRAATSRGEARPRGGGPGKRSNKAYSDEDVFHLPGTIDISSLERFKALEASSSGRQVLRRFMVRGHWRRAAGTWSDQRLRWIEPYWKGPDMGMIIERDYRLRP